MPSGRGKKSSNRIVLNVGGVRHETFLSTLKTIPDTRLSYLGDHHTTVARSPEYDASKGEYFFDRHPGVFPQILNFYRTGRLHCPSDVCGPLFEEELGFWGIDEQQVESCCWENYKQHKEKQEKLKYFKLPGFEETSESTCQSKDSGLFEDVDDVPSWWSKYQPKVWKSLEEPYTSFWAKLVGIVSFVVFTAYIIKFSLSTLEYFNDRTAPRYIALKVTHLICISWFTMDFALRLLFSPDKRAFIKSPYTWTDFIPLVLLYVFFFYPMLQKIPFLEMVVMIKAARIFQLFRFSYVLQVLVNTLKASSSELCLLLVIMGFVMVVFASFVYFLERHEPGSDFISVPDSMWWAVITMTTVGYGEVHPRTWIGKTVGSACAICGVLVIALPVSVVASNFSLFYTYAKARLNLPPKKRRIAFSHALTSMQNQRTQCAIDDGAHALNFTSLYSERQTDRSYPASDVSISCSVTPRGSLRKSSFWSLRSISKMLRPTKRTSVSRSKSLNSVFSDYKPQKKTSTGGITLKFDPPSRSTSAIDVTRDQRQGSLTTGDSTLLNSTCDRGKTPAKENTKELPRTPFLNKSLYPLHLRRGAVSPASFSLKSASTASSLNALPRGYNELCNALSGKGPIILLSDQGSVQSLCSLNSRMTCSCASVKSVGSDGSQGAPANATGTSGNLTPTGSDGSIASSPPPKVENLTLSVPVEYHGKRKGKKGNQFLLEMETTTSLTNANANYQTTHVETMKLETDGTNLNKKDMTISPRNEASSGACESERTHMDESSGNPCKECQETRESPVTFENTNVVTTSCLQTEDRLSNLEIKSPVKPVPVVGRVVSAYSVMEYSLCKDKFQGNGQAQEGCQDVPNTSGDKHEPKRRHSAFTSCNSISSSSKGRRGRLSTGCMKQKVAECEPLINETAMQANLYDEVFISDKYDDDEVQNITSVKERGYGLHTGKRLRKSGLSAHYSPPKFSKENEDTASSGTKNTSTKELEENWTLPVSQHSTKGYLPTVANYYSELEVTSQV